MGAPQFAANTKIIWLFILTCLLSVECVQPAAPQGRSPSFSGAAAAPAGATAGAAAGATAGAAECSLRLVGFGDRPGIKSASLSCTGGIITVAAHEELEKYWGPKKALPGVAWNDGDDCVTHKRCLLTVCGKSNAVFDAATVTSLKADSDEAAWRLPVCVTKGSTVTFRRSSFTMNKDVVPLVIHSNGTSVLVDQCTIQGNTNTNGSFSSAVRIEDAHLTILSSTVAANTAAGTSSGAITAAGTAQINIQGSSFMKNTAANGAAMHVRDQAVVTIQGSRFEANNATVRGGAILATNQAQVKVLPGKAGSGSSQNTFRQNQAVECGGDLHVLMRASVILNTAVLTGSAAQAGGSLCMIDNATISVVDSTFIGARAAKKAGGCVAAAGSSILNMSHTMLSGCSSAMCGGGIAVFDWVRLHLVKTTINRTISGTDGGSLCVKDSARAEASTSTFINGRASNSGGCVTAHGDASLRFVHTLVSTCHAPQGGGGIGVSDQARLELLNSTVTNNMAGFRIGNGTYTNAYGGGVGLLHSASMLLGSSELSSNYARYAGGGLHLSLNTSVSFRGGMKSIIRNNTAGTTGGGIRLSSRLAMETLEDFVVVDGNTASGKPSNVSAMATSIQVLSSNADNLVASDSREGFLQLTLNVSSRTGMPSDDKLVYSLFDANNVQLYDQNLVTQGIELKEAAISIKRPPGTYYLVLKSGFTTSSARANVTVNIGKCPKGHVTGGRDDTCNKCPVGLFSFDPRDAQCNVCGANAVCPGGAVVWPAEGFWNSAPQSVQMHRCLNRQACLGARELHAKASNKTASRRLLGATVDATYKTDQCAQPYEGNLCGECKQGWGKVRPFLCRKCMSHAAIVMLYVVAAFAMMGLVRLLVHFSTSADLAPRTDLQTPIPAELLRALVIHAQWLYIISMMVGVPWPATIAWPLQVIGGIWSSTSGSSIGFECILRGSRGLPVAVQKLLICLFTPAGILCSVLMFEAGMHYLRPQRSARAGHDFASVVMCIVFMFLPTWVNTALSLFTCVTLDTPVKAPYQAEAVGSWWVEDMSQLCYSRSGYHRGWALGLGIPLTLLFCVALPAGVFVFMWFSRKQGKLQDMQFQNHYGFMYRLWKDEWCWWESVVLLETCALVMVSTFGFALGSFYQGILSATVLACVGMLLLAVKPFKCPAAGRVAVLSVCVLFFTAQVALTFIPYNSVGPPAAYGNVMGVALILANVVFLAGTTWKLVSVVDWALLKKTLHMSAVGRCCSDAANMAGPPKEKGPAGPQKKQGV